jgi:hypothetical protein
VLSGFLAQHEGLRRAAAPRALRFWVSILQALLIQVGLAIRALTSHDTLGWLVFGIGCAALVTTYLLLMIFQAAYRTTRDFTNLPAGSDLCARMELDVQRVLGKDAAWKLAGLLFVIGTLLTALSL